MQRNPEEQQSFFKIYYLKKQPNKRWEKAILARGKTKQKKRKNQTGCSTFCYITCWLLLDKEYAVHHIDIIYNTK